MRRFGPPKGERDIPKCTSAPCAEPVKHRCDAVEKLIAHFDVARLDVAPGDGYAQRGSRLAVGPSSSGEASDAMTALATITLRDVEGDRA